MLLKQKVAVKWNNKIRKYYEELGYPFTHNKDVFYVDIQHLSKGSNSLVKVQCDYCGKVIEKEYYNYNNQIDKSIIKKDCCESCKGLKAKETNKIKYGEESIMYVNEFKEKIKNTCLQRYGVENPMQNELFKQKCLNNSAITKQRNNTVNTSITQIYVCNNMGGILNYPIKALHLDIAFPDKKIYVEIDGSGHNLNVKKGEITQEEFDKKEMKRWYALYNRGWKEIRIITTKDKIPTKEIINFIKSYGFEQLNNHSWIHFNIDKGTIETSNSVINYDYGELLSWHIQNKHFKVFEQLMNYYKNTIMEVVNL